MISQQLIPLAKRDALTEDRRHGKDERVANALEEFAASVEAGQPLSKDALLAKYADVADELRGCLDSLEFIREIAPQLADAPAADSSPPQYSGEGQTGATAGLSSSAGLLGDFRILRELGRGGMGVVYEAEQTSLSRRVALKVLPFAAMLDKQQLARFKNEARAAATLDHPNIVAIYSVGVERGVHYYAMQFIEGQSLAQVVEQLRHANPSPPLSLPGTLRVAPCSSPPPPATTTAPLPNSASRRPRRSTMPTSTASSTAT
jgi:hypothetical protein